MPYSHLSYYISNYFWPTVLKIIYTVREFFRHLKLFKENILKNLFHGVIKENIAQPPRDFHLNNTKKLPE